MQAPISTVDPDPFAGLPFAVPSQYEVTVRQAADRYGIRPELLAAQIEAESGFQNLPPNSAGARGIAQFMPGTALGIGVNPMDPTQAIFGAAKLDAAYIDKYGSEELALAAYNAGPGAVDKYGRHVPPFAETQTYVSKILAWAGGGDPAPTVTPGATAQASTVGEALARARSGTAWQRLGKGAVGILFAMLGFWFAFSKTAPVRAGKQLGKRAAEAATAAAVVPK